MKILPIFYNINAQKVSPTHQRENILGTSNSDSFECSFNGIRLPLPLYKSTNTDAVHCPVCGTKMFSRKTFESLRAEAEKLTNASELFDFIAKYRDYIPFFAKDILNFRFNHSLDKLSVKDCVKILYSQADNSYHRTFDSTIEYLRLIAESMPEENEIVFSNLVKSIDKNDDFRNFKDKYLQYISQLNILPRDLYSIGLKTLPPLYRADRYKSVFTIPNIDSLSDGAVSRNLFDLLFHHSKVNYSPFTFSKSFEEFENNQVLLCGFCNSVNRKYTFYDLADFSDSVLLNNMKKYLMDLLQLDLKEIIPSAKGYIRSFCYLGNNNFNFQKGIKPFDFENYIKTYRRLLNNSNFSE